MGGFDGDSGELLKFLVRGVDRYLSHQNESLEGLSSAIAISSFHRTAWVRSSGTEWRSSLCGLEDVTGIGISRDDADIDLLGKIGAV